MIDEELVSLGPNKPFQTIKHHILLSVLRLGSGQPVQSHGGTVIFSSKVGSGIASIVRPPKNIRNYKHLPTIEILATQNNTPILYLDLKKRS